ncbi:MAG: hypothetical protein KAJ95_02390 [Gammaproteobacteria bacterium]|nr:hypothetical protein [Gammaproteobacteria bacterium]
MNTGLTLLFTLVLFCSSAAQARECKSCQGHRNGGSINYGNNYAPGGIYQSGGNYYPGGVYPSYGYGGSSYNRYNNNYGSGRIRQTCGEGGGGCVTTYRGPASDIQYLPKINRHIRRSYPSSISNPWKRPMAVPLK